MVFIFVFIDFYTGAAGSSGVPVFAFYGVMVYNRKRQILIMQKIKIINKS